MHPKYPHICSPFQLGPVQLKNHFYPAPHAVPMKGHMFARYIGEPNAPKSMTEAHFADFDMGALPLPADMPLA